MPIKFTPFGRPTALELRSFAASYRRRYAATMRVLFCLCVLTTSVAVAEIMALDPQEIPTNVVSSAIEFTAKLGTASIVRFRLTKQHAVSVDITVAGKRSVSDMRKCALPSSIHADGMELLRHDLREDTHRRDSFTLLFDVGSAKDRKFGKLPRVQLTWDRGRLVTALVTHLVAENSYFSEPLCDPDVQPNNSLERSRDG